MTDLLTAKFRSFPSDFYSNVKKVLISGENSMNYPENEFVIIYKNDEEILNLEIKFEYGFSSPFRQIEFYFDFIVIGFEDFIYLYNLKTNKASQIKMDGYFGHIYFMENELLVCSATNMICINSDGNIKWICNNLGIDGVMVEEIDNEIITGIGEWDPPGGWKQFKLSSKTGKKMRN